jgi:Arc/MetJ-type ribon-helix-helix transcriptional regulator
MEAKVTIRLPKELLDGLDNLVALGKYNSRSQAVREALKDILSRNIHSGAGDTQDVNVNLPERFLSDLDFLVKVDYYKTRESAVYEAIKIHLYETLDLYKIKTRSEAMQEIGFDLASAEIQKKDIDKLLKRP